MGPHHARGADVSKKSAATVDWERLWVATRQDNWTSLAVIPSDTGVDIKQVAESMVAAGRQHGEKLVSLLNAIGAELNDVRQLVDKLNAITARGEWVIVAVDPIADNPSVVPLVRAASSALLVVRLGESLLASAQAAIDTVGRSRFLGSVVLDRRRAPQGKIVPVPRS
jgi:hypothetical protein